MKVFGSTRIVYHQMGVRVGWVRLEFGSAMPISEAKIIHF